jgi:hypothetical protein
MWITGARCHTGADSDTSIGDPRRIGRRNIAALCRLAKPVILLTIDALAGDRKDGECECVKGAACLAGRERRFLPAWRERRVSCLVRVRSDR